MGVGRCERCGTYFEGSVCSVCHRARETVATATRRPEGSRPWELTDDAAPDETAGDGDLDLWKPTNPWAIAALGFGLLGGAVVPVVFGMIALNQIDQHGRETGRGIARTGIVLGCVWIVVLLVVLVKLATS